MKKRPIQIREGVIHDPNAPHRPPEGVPKRDPKFRVPDPCPGYAKLKSREELVALAGQHPYHPPLFVNRTWRDEDDPGRHEEVY